MYRKRDDRMSELRVIIAGGRDFDDYDLLKKETLSTLSKAIYEITGEKKIAKEKILIISGGARGADWLGEKFASEFGLRMQRFPAMWDRYGRRAGYMRNTDMAKFAHENNTHGLLIAFWDGQSKGTKHMIDIAKKEDLRVSIVNY